MRLIQKTTMALCLTALAATTAFADVRWFGDVETGAAFAGYNDVRIPGDAGTRFSLTDDLTTDPNYFVRLRLGATIAERHNLFALYAPLRLQAKGELDRPLEFDDARFPAGAPLRATYRFDSYRLTYRYDIVRADAVEFGLGATGKVRDAAISVDGPQFAEKANTGFVPLINFRLNWKFAADWGLLLDGDALVGPQGRAEDVALAFQHAFNENVVARLGYRMLEGGADNDEVYSFALIHYALAGATIAF